MAQDPGTQLLFYSQAHGVQEEDVSLKEAFNSQDVKL